MPIDAWGCILTHDISSPACQSLTDKLYPRESSRLRFKLDQPRSVTLRGSCSSVLLLDLRGERSGLDLYYNALYFCSFVRTVDHGGYLPRCEELALRRALKRREPSAIKARTYITTLLLLDRLLPRRAMIGAAFPRGATVAHGQSARNKRLLNPSLNHAAVFGFVPNLPASPYSVWSRELP